MADKRRTGSDRAWTPNSNDVEGMTKYGPSVFDKLFGTHRDAIRSKYEAQREALRDWISRTWGDGWQEELKKRLSENRRQEQEELDKLAHRLRRQAEEERQRKAEEAERRREKADPRYQDRRAVIDRYRAIEKRRAGRRGGLTPPFDFELDDFDLDAIERGQMERDGGALDRSAVDGMIGDPDYYDPSSPRGAKLRRIAAAWFRRNAG